MSRARAYLVLTAAALVATTPAAAGSGAATVPPYVLAYSSPVSAAGYNGPVVAVRADGSDPLRLSSGGGGGDYPAEWSPDGRQLLFERADSTHVYSTIWVVGLIGDCACQASAATPLGGSPYDEFPAWSPDGTQVAYQEQTDSGTGGARADTSFELWVERPDGSGRHRLATGGTWGSSADWVEGSGWDWSPDSTRIAVVEPDPGRSSANDDPERLAIVDTASARVSARAPLSLAEPAAWDGWAWSEDGARMAYFGPSGGLRVLDVRSGAVVAEAPVARGDVRYQGTSLALAEYGIGWIWLSKRTLAVIQAPRSHPRQFRLAVVSAATGRSWVIPANLSNRVVGSTSLTTQWVSTDDGAHIALFARRPGSTTPNVVVADVRRHTTRIVGAGTAAAWSPDGSELAIVNGCTLELAIGSTVPRPAGACDRLPEWPGDGTELVFTRTQNGTKTVLAFRPDTQAMRTLVPTPATEVADWSAACAPGSAAGSYQYDWLLPDLTDGTLQLVHRPQPPADSLSAWHCW